jgi:hypothetical protein
VKYYLGQPSIVIPKDNFQEVYSFKLVEDQVQIAVAYVKSINPTIRRKLNLQRYD